MRKQFESLTLTLNLVTEFCAVLLVHLGSYENTVSLVWLFVLTILDKVLCKTQHKLASFLRGAKSSSQ